jgi:hypothetical protein
MTSPLKTAVFYALHPVTLRYSALKNVRTNIGMIDEARQEAAYNCITVLHIVHDRRSRKQLWGDRERVSDY